MAFFTSCVTVQPLSMENEPHVQVYENLEGSQSELFLAANEWMIKTFNNAESVIQHSDKDEGVLMGKYLMHGTLSTGMYGSDNRIFAMIDVRVKDGRARVSITPQGSWYPHFYKREHAIADMESLSESFHSSIQGEKIDF